MCVVYEYENVEALKDPFFLPSMIMIFDMGKITEGILMKKYGIGITRARKIIKALQELGVAERTDRIVKHLIVSPKAIILFIDVYVSIFRNKTQRIN